MRIYLGKAKKLWMEFAFAVGEIVSSLFLIAFYYSFFALFALPYRLLQRGGKPQAGPSWVMKQKSVRMKDLEREF
ncbi:MAG: hypothetical protein Q8R20_00235 [Nanoarchaeota archaeon]|nr:hypothetical protein [Nanoarchaeota archaeon]